MPHILALIDGSTYAASVCDHAAWAAQQLGADIELLHTLAKRKTGAGEDLSGAIGLGARSALLEDLTEQDAAAAKAAKDAGRALLDEALARLEGQGFSEISLSLRHGELAETLAHHPADLLVVGKRGQDHETNQDHLGSNLERVVRAADRPVLVANRSFAAVQKAVFAYDDGPSARKGLEALSTAPFKDRFAVTVLSVSEPGNARAKAAESAAEKLRAAGYDAVSKAAPGDAEKVITHEVESASAGLLIMGAYGHSRIRSLIIGSTTSAMVRSCRIPLLLFR